MNLVFEEFVNVISGAAMMITLTGGASNDAIITQKQTDANTASFLSNAATGGSFRPFQDFYLL